MNMPHVNRPREVDDFFELSYAQYLTIPRSIMQAMPIEWQYKIVRLLDQLDDTFDWRPREGKYWCRLRDARGRLVDDPLMQYRHPDTHHIEKIRRSPRRA